MRSLDVSGGACGETYCDALSHETSGGCYSYKVKELAAGTCHLTATATDGQTAARDVSITVMERNCCGDIYTCGLQEAAGQPETVEITF